MLFILDRHEKVVAIFTNNGSPESCPYFNDALKENLDNGTSSYEFTIPSTHDAANLVQEGGYVVRANLDNELVMFTIMQVEDTHTFQSTKYIYAENAGLELLNDIFRPVTHISKNATQILDILLADTRWTKGDVEYFGVKNFVFDDYQPVLTAIQYAKEVLGAELRFRVKMKNGEVSGRYVDFVKQRGTDTKKRFAYTKDILSIRRKIDMSEVVTALIGVGKDDVTFREISYYTDHGDPFTKPLNQDWVGDSSALQRFGVQGKHLFGVFRYDTGNKEDLLKKTWAELQRRKTPQITYELDVALLERLADIEHEAVRLGDTVYVIDETFSPALYLEARIVDLETCFSDPSKDKAILGNFKAAKSNITPEMRALQRTLLKKEEKMYKGPIPPVIPQRTWDMDDLNATWE